MKHIPPCATWGLAGVALLLSPIIVIFAIPVAVGIGLDIFELAGEVPIALALCSPVAVALVRSVPLTQTAAGLRPRERLGNSPGLDYIADHRR